MPQPLHERQFSINDAIAKGTYSNEAVVSHTREEFVVDFIMNAPGRSEVVARVVMSPGHVKRLAGGLAKTLAGYEKQFAVQVTEAPKGHIGFTKPED